MTDPERDHLLGRIADLERRLRRWRLACLALLVLLLLPVVLGGLLGVWWVPRLERERTYRHAIQEAERLLEEQVDDRKARLQALEEVQESLQQYERQKALAEEEQRQAQQGPAGGKE
jgi:C4-dicarboxylate-specific signal transduction histidine kinase